MLEALHFPAHPTTWAMAPMVWLVVLVYRERYRAAVLALLLLFCCKEEFPFAGVALALALVKHRPARRFACWAMGLSCAWLLFAFCLRSAWWGPVSNYGSGLFDGLHEPWRYLRQRLRVPGMLSRLGSLLVTLGPLLLWLRVTRSRFVAWPLVMLLPLVGIRFLGMAWRHHYMAVVIGGVIAALVPALARREIPGWVLGATLAVLVTTNTNRLKFAAQSYLAPVRQAAQKCPRAPERMRSIAAAADWIKKHPGRVLVQQNLALALAGRPDVYVMGGPQPAVVEPYAFVWVENAPYGNDWPIGRERLAAWRAHWRVQPHTEAIVDDGHVWLGQGAFTLPRAE